MPRFIVNGGSKEEASRFAAEMIATMFGQPGNFLFGTATGQTPVLTYQEFAKIFRERAKSTAAKQLRFIQLDNYISPGSKEKNLPEYSYQTELAESIWKVPHDKHFIPKEYAKDPEEEAMAYYFIIRKQHKWADRYVQLLGIGDEDGHIAFNMPGTPFVSTVHVTDLNKETIKANAEKFFGGDESLVPKKAITTGIADILEADMIVLEAFGAKKAEIIYKAFFENPTSQIPASALQKYEGILFVILDDESSAVIQEKVGKKAFVSIFDIPKICDAFCETL